MRYLFFLILFTSTTSEAVSVSVLTNEDINGKYGIRIELAEKSIEKCNDIVIYAPLEIQENELGMRTLEKIESSLHSATPSIKEVLEGNNLRRYEYDSIGEHARVLGCVKKAELSTIYFRFLYINSGSPSVVLVAPLM